MLRNYWANSARVAWASVLNEVLSLNAQELTGLMPLDDHVFEYFLHLPTPCMGFRLCVVGSRIPGLSILRRSLLAMLWLVLRAWDGWWFCCSFRVFLLVELFRHLAGLLVWCGGFLVASERL